MISPPALVDSRSVRRLEVLVLVVLILSGLTLRGWRLSRIGLNHFDEGVYAFSALGVSDASQPHRVYPDQLKFSPPAFFSLVGLAFRVLGAPLDRAAFLVNVILGTLTIPALWWVGRNWFGGPAGLASAALLTFSEYHIAYSRTALTDVAFVLVFLVALALIVSAIERRSVGWAIAAGVAVGLAWNTKYHGWFALVAAGAALVPFSLYGARRGRSVQRLFLLWGITMAVAVACYLPWAAYIQSEPGGYVALLQYQRILIHPSDWFGNIWRQAQQQFVFEGVFSRSSMLVAALCSVVVTSSGVRPWRALSFLVTGLAISSLVVGSAGTAAALALLSVPALLRRPAAFSSWLVLSWLGLWLVSAPLFLPYARLVLPFTLATYLVAGWWLARMVSSSTADIQWGAWRSRLAVGAAVVGAFGIATAVPNPGNPWRPSRSVADAASAMEALIPAGSRVIVIGEPAVAFYLHLANRPAFERTEDPEELDELDAPVFVVTGVFAKRAPFLREGLKALGSRLVPLETYPVLPSDFRLVDDLHPKEARAFRVSPDHTFALTLYSLKPKSAGAIAIPR